MNAGPGNCYISKEDLRELADGCDPEFKYVMTKTMPSIGNAFQPTGDDVVRRNKKSVAKESEINRCFTKSKRMEAKKK